MTARQVEGQEKGFYIAALGGHNAEAHNHNDVGSFILYYNGEPAVLDAGVETYTRKTFSSERYSIWTMQSAFHNLPTVNGVMQRAGRQFAASNVSYQANDDRTEFSLNLEKAYPPEAGMQSWRRSLTLDRRGGKVVLVEQYALNAAPRSLEMTMMLRRPPRRHSDRVGIIDTDAGPVRVEYEGPELMGDGEPIQITDTRLGGVWGERLYRVLLKAVNPPQSGEWRFTFTAG
jgi:hypothetical protein